MLDALSAPDLITEITLQPVRRYDVDAAILFSDIVVPLRAIGVGIDIKPGVGPVVDHPIRSAAEVAKLRPLSPDDVPYVTKAVTNLVSELGDKPLIGFAGGPFTLASYLVDGGPSKNFELTKAIMYGQPELWADLMSRLADITIELPAGADRGRGERRPAVRFVGRVAQPGRLPRQRAARIASGSSMRSSRRGVPRIHFGVNTGELLGVMGEAGADVVGVDWRVPLDEAVSRVEPGKALQGNLDPAILLAPWPVIEQRARLVLDRGRTAEGHIFNLGHGVLPATDPDVLARLTEFVHTASARSA